MEMKVHINLIYQHYFDYTFCETAQKLKFSMKDFFSKCDQIGNSRFGHISHLLKKSVMENFTFCAVSAVISG